MNCFEITEKVRLSRSAPFLSCRRKTSESLFIRTGSSLFPALLASVFLTSFGGHITLAATAKPNMILILADDLGYSDLGCHGGEIHTPNLDRLVENGLRFTSLYTSAKCEPTRASLMGGPYWQDCGPGIKQGITMGQAMQLAGYNTYAIGKWHLAGNPVERGFDHYFGHLSGASDYFKGNPSDRLDNNPLWQNLESSAPSVWILVPARARCALTC